MYIMMYPRDLWLAIFSSLALQASVALGSEDFNELLTLRPLRDGRVASHFSFVVSQDSPTLSWERHDATHNTLFPLEMDQMLREYDVSEMHLTLNAGKWDYGRWGMPSDDAVASGAELWVWLSDIGPVSADERWKGLRNALSGLFCASVGQLDELRTTSPAYSFRPEGEMVLQTLSLSHALRHASLPAERVCTENLTPFLKLLPCKSAAGIATLLDPHRIFDADWHGMGIHVTRTTEGGVQLELSLQAVFNPVRLQKQEKRDFSLFSLFGHAVSNACPVASNSGIEVQLPAGAAYTIIPEPHALREGTALYDTQTVKLQPLDISVSYPAESVFAYPLGPPEAPLTKLEVSRTLTGTSQSRGRLSVRIRNTGQTEHHVLYVETMPWLISFFLHTLEVTVDEKERDDLFSLLSYSPAEPHGHPTLMEAQLVVPPNATLHLSMEITKSFLRYTEHPPDAQRGWDLPPATFFLLSGNDTGRKSSPRLYSPALLVDVATPDFSMPYNVIIMSSTLIAFIFATIFNLFTRNLVYVQAVATPAQDEVQNAQQQDDAPLVADVQ